MHTSVIACANQVNTSEKQDKLEQEKAGAVNQASQRVSLISDAAITSEGCWKFHCMHRKTQMEIFPNVIQ